MDKLAWLNKFYKQKKIIIIKTKRERERNQDIPHI